MCEGTKVHQSRGHACGIDAAESVNQCMCCVWEGPKKETGDTDTGKLQGLHRNRISAQTAMERSFAAEEVRLGRVGFPKRGKRVSSAHGFPKREGRGNVRPHAASPPAHMCLMLAHDTHGLTKPMG